MRSRWLLSLFCFLFFNDTATTEIYTLSLHDALPIFDGDPLHAHPPRGLDGVQRGDHHQRSEEHTSELQSRENLVCRLLLEKKKKDIGNPRSALATVWPIVK